MRPDAINPIRQQALKFLGRREYSRHELQRKLVGKGWDVEEVTRIIDELAAAELQSDARFLEAYIRYRAEAGYGPRRILFELAERGISDVPAELVDENSPECWMRLQRVWEKKFNHAIPQDLKTKAKQIRFLEFRGFSPAQVHLFFKQVQHSR